MKKTPDLKKYLAGPKTLCGVLRNEPQAEKRASADDSMSRTPSTMFEIGLNVPFFPSRFEYK